MNGPWYAKLLMVVAVAGLIAGLVAGCAAETTTVTQTAAAATVTQTQVTTQTAPGATITQTVTQTVGATPTAPQTFKLKFVSGLPPAHPFAVVIHEWLLPEMSRRVAEYTNYRIEFTELQGGTLAKFGEVRNAIETGLAEMGVPIPAFEPAVLPLLTFSLNIPFGVPDIYKLIYVTEKMSVEVPELITAYEAYNQRALHGFTVLSNFQLYSKVPIDAVEDLKGMKVGSAAANAPWTEGVGAIAVTTTAADIYNGLATGMFEAVMWSRASVYSAKLHEIAGYEIEVNLGAIQSGYITINLDVWDSLPPEVQVIMEDVGREYTMQLAHKTIRDDVRVLEVMKAGGFQVLPFPEEEKVKWGNMLPNLPDKKAKEWDAKGLPGSEVFRAYFKYAQEIGAELPRWWEIT